MNEQDCWGLILESVEHRLCGTFLMAVRKRVAVRRSTSLYIWLDITMPSFES